MNVDFSYLEIPEIHKLDKLKSDWLQSLTSPPDGMWQSFRSGAAHYGIRHADDFIGYACIGENKKLIQFYIRPEHLGQGPEIFNDFLKEFEVRSGIVGTNNPVFLSLALHFAQTLSVHTYLFREHLETNDEVKDGYLRKCTSEELDTAVEFYHYSIGAPEEWLSGYLGDLIGRGELFILEKRGIIIGACEVRKSKSAPAFADIGMVVSRDYRKQGYGSFLLNQAKSIAKSWGKTPICSCEKDNIGSLKSILNCGFFSNYQLVAITFR